LDIAYCHFTIDTSANTRETVLLDWHLAEADTLEFSEQWQSRLLHLPQQDALTFAKTNAYFGHYTAELVNAFLKEFPVEVDFIAAHGHTIFHHPEKRVTVQIGDGAALAARTGLPVVCDFRTHDIAIDGEGAPLAPLADQLLLKGYDFYLNLGGIANISANVNGKFVAFDIGPANQVLNALAHQLKMPYDDGGQIAAQGQLLPDLLHAVNQVDYFRKMYPKSLDNEYCKKTFIPYYFLEEGQWANKLHTAVEQLAQQTVSDIKLIIEKEKGFASKDQYSLLATGGGAFNTYLMNRMQALCGDLVKIVVPDPSIIQFKEAALMALMGVLRVANVPNCISTVTGAKIDTIGGAIYQGTSKVL